MVPHILFRLKLIPLEIRPYTLGSKFRSLIKKIIQCILITSIVTLQDVKRYNRVYTLINSFYIVRFKGIDIDRTIIVMVIIL